MKPILKKTLFPPEPAIPAAYALSLLGWLAGMVLFFSVPVFYLFFSFCAIGGKTSYFSMGLWLASLGIETLLAVYALWAVNRFYYRQLASPRAFAACWLAALVGATMLTWCDNSSASPIFAAMIPTYLRRELWLEGKFIPVILLTLFIANSMLLPHLTGWRKQHLIATTAATSLAVIAVGFGILGLGMFGNYFKYFSLGGISDFHSPVWEVPQAVEISLLLSFGAALAAAGLRLIFWRAIAGDELRSRLPKILCRGALLAIAAYLAATLFAVTIRAMNRQTLEVPVPPEDILRQQTSDDTKRLLCELASPIFMLEFDTRMPLVPDPENAAMLEKAIAGQPGLLAAIDRFTASLPQSLSFDRNRAETGFSLLRIARIQAVRLTAALYRQDQAESLRRYRELTEMVRHQADYLAISNPRLVFQLDTEWLNRTEELLNCGTIPATEFATARDWAAAAPERLSRQLQLALTGDRLNDRAAWQKISTTVPLLSPQSRLDQLNQPLLLASQEGLYRAASYPENWKKESFSAVSEHYRALFEALDATAPTPVREGEITRHVYEIFKNDIASHNNSSNPKLQKYRYRQFGTGANSIILIEKSEAQNPSRKSP